MIYSTAKRKYIRDINSFQFKKPSDLILWYIQFEVPEIHIGSNFGSENSWTFERSLEEKAFEAVDYVRKRINEIKNNFGKPTIVNQISVADEIIRFKQLLD